MNDNQIKEIQALPILWGHIVALGFVLKFISINSIWDIALISILHCIVAFILCGAILFFQYQYANDDEKNLLKEHHHIFFEEKKSLFKYLILLFKTILLLISILLILIMLFSNLQREDLLKSTLSFSYMTGVLIYCLVLPLYFYIPILMALKFFILPSHFSFSIAENHLQEKTTIQTDTPEDQNDEMPASRIKDQSKVSQRPPFQAKQPDHPKPKFPPFPPILVHRKKLLDDAVLLSAKHDRLIKQYVEVLDYVEHSIQRVQQAEDKNFIMQTEQETFINLQNAIAEYLSYSPEQRLRYQANQKRIPDLWLSQFIEQSRQTLIIATEKIYHNDVQSLVDHQTFLQQKLKFEHIFEPVKNKS